MGIQGWLGNLHFCAGSGKNAPHVLEPEHLSAQKPTSYSTNKSNRKAENQKIKEKYTESRPLFPCSHPIFPV
ncbi:MAG: hypothetical protein PHR77_20935 [Kiritimatiellae bacterium]|nr:hypothetical protein [Kiritimatiellia bacterium]MDD5520337.1 hypothetical protein [Kiritimatiellia bacterium]